MNTVLLLMVLSGLMFHNQFGMVSDHYHTQYKYHQKIQELYGGFSLHDSLRISYVGNMGVLLETRHKTVIIDGFHQYYQPTYQYPTQSMVRELTKGQYLDFSPIEISLVTHHHRDHFSASLNREFLVANPAGVVLGSSQIQEAIISGASEKNIADRVLLAPYSLNVQQMKHEGIIIKSIRCDHVNPQRHGEVENIAYLVEMGGYTIFHPGDSDWNLAKRSIEELRLDQLDLDVMILPFWMLNQSAKNIIARLKPKHVIVVHLSPNYIEKVLERVEHDYLNGHVFHELGDGLVLN